MNLENFMRKNWMFLIEKTTNSSAILSNLYSKEIISYEELHMIKNPYVNATSFEVYDNLYTIILKKNLDPVILKKVLLETDNEHIVNILWKNPDEIKKLEAKFWNVGHRNENFTGRYEVIEFLENQLELDIKAREISTQKFVLLGMGGVGKTAIVNEFVYRYRNKFSNIFWISAEFELIKQFYNLALELESLNKVVTLQNNPEFIQNLIRDWFEEKANTNWLIVFDNVVDFNDIKNFIPRFGGVLIATSRNMTNWSNFNEVHVNGFNKQDSIYLIRRFLKNNNESEFLNLVDEVGDLPLAIVNACNAIKNHCMTIDEYLKYSKEHEREILNEFGPNSDREISIGKSVKISLDKIKEESPLAHEFLRIISFYRDQDIPKFFLEEFVRNKELNTIEIHAIVKVILKYGIVKLEIKDEIQLISIHKVVQKVIKLGVENVFETLLDCSDIIKNVCSKYPNLKENYVNQHSIHLLLYSIEFAQKDENTQNVEKTQILAKINCFLINHILAEYIGEIEDIDKIFLKYFYVVKEILDLKEKFELYSAMAACYEAVKNFEECLQCYKELLIISQEIFGEFSNQTIFVYSKIGYNLVQLKQFEEAQKFYEKSLQIQTDLNGSDSIKLIDLYNNLGSLFINLNEFERPLKYLEKCQILIEKHSDVQNTLSEAINLSLFGELKTRMGDIKKAKIYHQKEIDIYIKLYGENSQKLLEKLNKLADKYIDLNPVLAYEVLDKLGGLESKYHGFNGPSPATSEKMCTAILIIKEIEAKGIARNTSGYQSNISKKNEKGLNFPEPNDDPKITVDNLSGGTDISDNEKASFEVSNLKKIVQEPQWTVVNQSEISEIAELLADSHLITDNWDIISVDLLKLKPLDILCPITSLKTDYENFEKIYNTLLIWKKQKGNDTYLEEISQITIKYCKFTFGELVKYSQNLKSKLEIKSKIVKKEIWNIPARNVKFTGRQKYLKNLVEKLNFESVKISNLQIALIGPAGIGKTSIAIEFIQQNKDKFSNIFWFESSAKTMLKKQISDLRKKLELENSIKTQDSLNNLKIWLENNTNWLMVLNNAVGYKEIEEFMPKLGGTILITSKNQENWSNFTSVPVQGLAFGESIKLIDKILKISDFEDYEILIKAFEFCPFDLVKSSHYIKSSPMNIPEYLKLYDDYLNSPQNVKLFLENFKISNFLVCKISLDQIKRLNLLTYEWLQICSFSSSQEIPKIYLKEFLKYKNLKPEIDLLVLDVEKLLLKYDLMTICRNEDRSYYSVHPIVQDSVKSLIENELEILKICDEIVRSSIQNSEDEEKIDVLYYANDLLLYVMSITNTLCSVIVHSEENLENQAKLQVLNEIISNLINSLFKENGAKCIEEFCEFYFDQEIFIMNELNNEYKMSLNLAEGFYHKGQNLEKGQNLRKVYLEKSLKFYKKNLSIAIRLEEFDQEVGYIFGRMGAIYFDLDNFVNAQFFLKKSLEQNTSNESSLGQIDLFIKMGQVYEKIGGFSEDSVKNTSVQFESAVQLYLTTFQDFSLENLFEKIITSDKDNEQNFNMLNNFFEKWIEDYKKVEKLDFLIICEKFGNFLFSKGKYTQARKYFHLSSEKMEKLDPDFLSQIRINYLLGLCEMKELEYYKSINLFKKAIEIIEKISKPDFVHQIRNLREINLPYISNEIENSNRFYYELFQNLVGPNDSEYAFLIDLYLNTNRKLLCEDLDYRFVRNFQSNLANSIVKLKLYKSQVYYYYYNFAIAYYYFVTNDLEKALQNLEGLMDFCADDNLKKFEFKASSLSLFKGVCLFELGRFEESKCEILKVLKFCEKNHLNFHYRNAQGFYELGRIFLKNEDFTLALENFRKSIVIFNQCCSNAQDNVYSAIVQKSIASCYYAIENKFDAYILFKKSFKIQDDVKYLESLKKAETSHSLASCYFDMRDFTKAKMYYEKALIIFEKILGPKNIKSFYTTEFIGRCLYNLKDYKSSLRFLKSALEIFEKSDSTMGISLSSVLFYISYSIDKIVQNEDLKSNFFQKAVDYKNLQKLDIEELLGDLEELNIDIPYL